MTYWLARVAAPVTLNVTEEEDLDSEETELIITSHGDASMDAFETSMSFKLQTETHEFN